jgi:antitoxin component of RelBE/YafQ-DinJ toxin-antitoxin module
LERVLEYMGLSMNKDQVVNTSIDGTERKRALIPFQLLNADHWRVQLEKESRRAEHKSRREKLKEELEELETKIDAFD